MHEQDPVEVEAVEPEAVEAVIDLRDTDETELDEFEVSEPESDVAEPVVDEATAGSPSVDALEDQLGKLQGAMDKLQAGDLDGAERTIESLEEHLSTLRH